MKRKSIFAFAYEAPLHGKTDLHLRRQVQVQDRQDGKTARPREPFDESRCSCASGLHGFVDPMAAANY